MKKFTNFGVENWWLDLSVGFLGGRSGGIGGGGYSQQSAVPTSIQFLVLTVCRHLSHSVIGGRCCQAKHDSLARDSVTRNLFSFALTRISPSDFALLYEMMGGSLYISLSSG